MWWQSALIGIAGGLVILTLMAMIRIIFVAWVTYHAEPDFDERLDQVTDEILNEDTHE